MTLARHLLITLSSIALTACGVPSEGISTGANTAQAGESGSVSASSDRAAGEAGQAGGDSASKAETSPPIPTEDQIQTIVVTDELNRPWSMVFLPDGSLLVAEKGGRIVPVSVDGEIGKPIRGVPRVQSSSQGGLLGMALSPTFEKDKLLYFSYSQRLKDKSVRTVVARATLDKGRLKNRKTIYRQRPSYTGGLHYGARLVFDKDGLLYVTLGERNRRNHAQKLDNGLGKIVRIKPDGKVPKDNPFVGRKKVHEAIYSYGHRNPQGAALHPITGELWVSEHGPQGGDEINRIKPGANYGWPKITYGREYGSGAVIGEDVTAPDVEAPLYYWVPYSIGPSALVFYTADKVPALTGSLLVGTLAGQSLSRLTITDDTVVSEERLLESLGERIRDVAQGPDGFPYLLTDSGKLIRIEAR